MKRLSEVTSGRTETSVVENRVAYPVPAKDSVAPIDPANRVDPAVVEPVDSAVSYPVQKGSECASFAILGMSQLDG